MGLWDGRMNCPVPVRIGRFTSIHDVTRDTSYCGGVGRYSVTSLVIYTPASRSLKLEK